MQAFIDWLNQLQLGMVWDYVVIIAASMLCIMFHVVSHGVVALKLGDPTARDAGRLTFNPIKHVDIWGLLMMAIFRFGWAKPVPIDMRNFKHPVRDMAITAAAGPISNVILAVFGPVHPGGSNLCQPENRRRDFWVYHYIYGVYGDFERGSCGIQCNSHSASGRQQGIKFAAAPERLL